MNNLQLFDTKRSKKSKCITFSPNLLSQPTGHALLIHQPRCSLLNTEYKYNIKLESTQSIRYLSITMTFTYRNDY